MAQLERGQRLGCIGRIQSRPSGTQIGLKSMQESIGKGCFPGKIIFFSQVLQELGYTLRKLGLVTKLCAKPLKGVKKLFLVFLF